MERWVKISGFDNYEISSYGNIKTIEKYVNHSRHIGVKCRRKERVLFPCVNNGYKSVSLSVDGKTKRKLFHRLIATAFIPNPENKPCVNHINGIKTDNRIENLEWVTYSENTRHAFATGLNYATFGMKGKIASLNKKSKPILQIDKQTGLVVKKFDSIHCVKRELNFDESNVCNCANNKRKTAYGFKWKYA